MGHSTAQRCARPAWLSGPGGLELSEPSGLSPYAGQLSGYSENNTSGKHRGLDGDVFNLSALANAGFRDAQLLVAASTTDNRWCPAACSGRLLMALCTPTANLHLGAHGARCATTTKAVHHAVGISCWKNSGCRPSRVNIIAQGLSTSLSHSLP